MCEPVAGWLPKQDALLANHFITLSTESATGAKPIAAASAEALSEMDRPIAFLKRSVVIVLWACFVETGLLAKAW
jgi:hypothetical protein